MQSSNEFKRIVLDRIPLIDVRAPIEFERGAFPTAVNLPLMDDEERRLVGICYKEKGQEAAIKLGYQLVSDEIRVRRIEAWKEQLFEHPDSMLYCFRGGLRSRISQAWMEEATGKPIVRLEGGYKAFRQFLLNELEPVNVRCKPIVLSGYTGAGKTRVIQQLEQGLDLERIGNHRGSAFGGTLVPQPSQIDFEHRLAFDLIALQQKGYNHIVIENEGRNVGKCYLPNDLAAYFSQGDVVLLETPLNDRVLLTYQEYVLETQTLYADRFGEAGLQTWFEMIKSSLIRIQRRLGDERYRRVYNLLVFAMEEQKRSKDARLHQEWIEVLLKEYYDPMYLHQMKKINTNILFTGNFEEVLAFLQNLKR